MKKIITAVAIVAVLYGCASAKANEQRETELSLLKRIAIATEKTAENTRRIADCACENSVADQEYPTNKKK